MKKLIPQPQKQEIFEGKYTFSEVYSFDYKRYPNAAGYLKEFLNTGDGEEIAVTIDNSLEREAYILEIGDSIKICASCEEGIFRAFSTLKQLACEKQILQMKIEDYPQIKNRGVMVDISRGKIPKTDTLLNMIDLLADIKYNQLQLYMDGFVFEYKHFSEYCKDTMPITVEELKKIKERCEKKFIKLVPNQNGFGHMEKWLKKPELADLGIKRSDNGNMDTLNPFDERAFKLIDTIYSDLLPEFDVELVNIGGDEPYSLGMGQTKDECEKKGKGVVYIEFMNKIIRLMNDKYKKTPMLWDDIVFAHPEILEKLDKSCIVMDWGYETEMPFMKRCARLKEMGLKFYVCPGTSTWGSITGRFTNMIYNIEAAVDACRIHNGEGFLLTDWGDGGNPQFFAMSLLPYIYGACCSWNRILNCDNVTYDKQVRIIKACEEYVDDVIFKAKGLGRILHKMANYYVLENQERMNGTYIWAEADMYCNKINYDNEYCTPYLEESDVVSIIGYMEDLNQQLSKYDDNVKYIKDIRCNCDMVILFADFIKKSIAAKGENITDDNLKQGFEDLKKNFREQWCVDNREAGVDIFIEKIDKILKKFN